MDKNDNDEGKILLEDMPIDVFQVIDKYLKLGEVINMCLSSKIIYDKHMSGKLIGIKASNQVEGWAPLSRFNSNTTDSVTNIRHAMLLEQGYTTTYHTYSADGLALLNMKFGDCLFGMENKAINFSLRGFPPPKGTIVHLLVDVSDNRGNASHFADCYLSKEEMYNDMLKPDYLQQDSMELFCSIVRTMYEGNEIISNTFEEDLPKFLHDEMSRLLSKDHGVIVDLYYIKAILP